MNNIRGKIHAKAAFKDACEFAHVRKETRWNNRLLKINDKDDSPLKEQMNNRIRGRIRGN